MSRLILEVAQTVTGGLQRQKGRHVFKVNSPDHTKSATHFSIYPVESMQSRQPGDLEERVSYIHSATHDVEGGKDGQYADLKTPGELEDGALAEGGALELCSKEAMGLFAQYAAIGVIYGLIPALNYPIFNIYLYLEGYQTA
ncbi:hypothetical protein As57867_007986, partial [Aphanomyces stellatus]